MHKFSPSISEVRKFSVPKNEGPHYTNMAHTKAKSAAKNSRESASKRLGVKLFDGEKVRPGGIIIRQRGTKFHPGDGVRRGNDDTLYAVISGTVKFGNRKRHSFDGSRKSIRTVSVI